MCLVKAGAVTVSVVTGGCPRISSLFVKLLLGVAPVAMTMSLVLPIVGREIDPFSWVRGAAQRRVAADDVAGWVASGAGDRVIRGLLSSSRGELVRERAKPMDA